jgi:uncharacterized membrane protein
MAKKPGIAKQIQEVEKYEYLLVEYLKELSNEITYLLLVVCSLFFFVLIGLFPQAVGENIDLVRTVFILLIVGGFALFGMSTIAKRKIEKKFELIFRKK